MKLIFLFIALSLNIFAQSNLLLLFDSGTTTPSTSYTTDSLKYYWDDDDLANGSVSSWGTNVASPLSLALAQATGTAQPTMTDSGVVYDGGDALLTSAPTTLGAIISMEFIIKIVDTTNNQYVMAGFRDASANIIAASISNNYFTVIGYDGASTGSRYYSTPLYNTLKHIIVTYDGDTTKVYINGSLVTAFDLQAVEQFSDAAEIRLGGYGSLLSANSIVRLFRIYKKELTASEVTTNYNSTSVQGKLP